MLEMKILFVCIFLAVMICNLSSNVEAAKPKLIPEDYDKDLRPGFLKGETDLVLFGLHIYQIGPLSESDMSMTLDIYLRAYWNDTRLQSAADYLFNRSSDNPNVKPPSYVNLKGVYADAIWRPNIYFLDSMLENTPDEYKDSEQLISWKPNAVDIDPNLNSTATFDIVPSLVKETHTQQWGDDIFYTKLCVHVQFKRKFHIYIVTMFLPSISLVGLSWVSFWIDKKAVPARAGLTITTILAQITLITGTANKFPGVADLKIGDIYMIVNFFFVFGSLIEFAVVNNATGNEAAAEKNLSQEVSEKIGPQENNNFNLVSNEVTPNHLGGAGLNSTTAFSGSEKSPNREATELLAEENLSVMSTPYGQNVRNQKLLGASANQKTRSRTSIAKPLAFIPRLFKKKDIDDISKVSFPCSFILWHAIFIVLGHRALEGQEHL
ncbi:gamma-aminobutyric acid receptor subunit rho-1-like isoform X2 [Symsagittifera roscoffensis]|uniref:gamma-aminobutyric acid receptor subunit rho-1-like isoform X2 n=1 Tax=Symsagittifera roscoffensis TaxID=84072 RepID=UPI00307B57D2